MRGIQKKLSTITFLLFRVDTFIFYQYFYQLINRLVYLNEDFFWDDKIIPNLFKNVSNLHLYFDNFQLK